MSLKFVPLLYIFLILLANSMFFSCESLLNTDKESGTPPLPPPFVEVSLRVDTLPRYYEPHTLQYAITVVGDSGQYPVNPTTGDTAKHVAMMFETSRYMEGTNAAAETLWAGPVDIGQCIVLEPAFQVTQTAKQRRDHIKLWWTFYRNDPPPSRGDSLLEWGYYPRTLRFHSLTGEYVLTTP